MKKRFVLDEMTDRVGLEKATAILETYCYYLKSEFNDNTENLSDDIVYGEMPIAYTTDETGEWEFQAIYDWQSETMAYYATSTTEEKSKVDRYSLKNAIEYGFDFGDAIYECESLIGA